MFFDICIRFIVLALMCLTTSKVNAQTASEWFQNTTTHLESIWDKGSNELYVPLYTYHMPYAYSQEKIDQYTEYPMGIGFGRGLINESGNWEGIYGMTFKDSHGIYQYMVGYGWIPMWDIGKNSDWKYGVGVTAFIMSRQDIMNYIPFPGVLPVASISYKNISLQAAYVPGGQNVGNVLFSWAKITLP
jgi:palmitoyl transferase